MSEPSAEFTLTPLSGILGQERGTRALTRLIEAGSTPPPLLFAGPTGAGKRTAALAFAASLVCVARRGADACGECSACAQVKSSDHVTAMRASSTSQDTPKSYPDVGLISVPPRKARISVLQARDLALSVTSSPFTLSHRVYVVDPADRLTPAAANALLKTLEEPPPRVALILATSAPASLPATIRSRLRRVPFGPLSNEVIEAILTGEGVPASESAARARWARGDLTRARAVDPAAESAVVSVWLDVLATVERGGDPLASSAAVAAGEVLGSSAEGARDAMTTLLEILRDVAAADSGAPPLCIDERDRDALADRFAAELGPLGVAAREVDRLRRELDVFNRNPRLAVEGAALAITGRYVAAGPTRT